MSCEIAINRFSACDKAKQCRMGKNSATKRGVFFSFFFLAFQWRFFGSSSSIIVATGLGVGYIERSQLAYFNKYFCFVSASIPGLKNLLAVTTCCGGLIE